jgi:hypothetical protein
MIFSSWVVEVLDEFARTVQRRDSHFCEFGCTLAQAAAPLPHFARTDIMFGMNSGAMYGGMIVWLVWLAISIFALVSFLRGMQALVRIAARLEGIERALAARALDNSSHVR